MSDAATPADTNKGGTPPASPAATPAVNATETDKVTLSKEEHDKLVRDAARASEAQSRADRLESVLKKSGIGSGSGHFKPVPPAPKPTPEEADAAAAEEDRKAERGLMALAIDPSLRQVFDEDPTLRTLITQNPLAVLPIYASDAIDAEDAVSLVKEALLKKVKQPANPPAKPAEDKVPPAPPAGGVNMAEKETAEAVEAARKNPNTEQAVAGMLKARLGRK